MYILFVFIITGPVLPFYPRGSASADAHSSVNPNPESSYGTIYEPGSHSAVADANAVVNGGNPLYPGSQSGLSVLADASSVVNGGSQIYPGEPGGDFVVANAYAGEGGGQSSYQQGYKPNYPLGYQPGVSGYNTERPGIATAIADASAVVNGGYGQYQTGFQPVVPGYYVESPLDGSTVADAGDFVNGVYSPQQKSYLTGFRPGYHSKLSGLHPEGPGSAFADASAIINGGYNLYQTGHQTGFQPIVPSYYSERPRDISADVSAVVNGKHNQHQRVYQQEYQSSYLPSYQANYQPVSYSESPSDLLASADSSALVAAGNKKILYQPGFKASSNYPNKFYGTSRFSTTANAKALVNGGPNYNQNSFQSLYPDLSPEQPTTGYKYPDVVPVEGSAQTTADATASGGYRLYQPGYNQEVFNPSYQGYLAGQGPSRQYQPGYKGYRFGQSSAQANAAINSEYSSYQYQPGHYPGYLPSSGGSSVADANAFASNQLGYGVSQEPAQANAYASANNKENSYSFGSLPASSQALAEAEAQAQAYASSGSDGNGGYSQSSAQALAQGSAS